MIAGCALDQALLVSICFYLLGFDAAVSMGLVRCHYFNIIRCFIWCVENSMIGGILGLRVTYN